MSMEESLAGVTACCPYCGWANLSVENWECDQCPNCLKPLGQEISDDDGRQLVPCECGGEAEERVLGTHIVQCFGCRSEVSHPDQAEARRLWNRAMRPREAMKSGAGKPILCALDTDPAQ